MRSQKLVTRRWYIIFAVGLFLLLMLLPATAQDELHPPQFLFREEDRLILVNGYTGETTELPIEITNGDYFEWLPDGSYLLAQLHEGEDSNGHCINLYDVDSQVWVFDEPIACAVEDVIVSNNAAHIFYSINDGTNGVLWMYSLKDETREELYRTTEGDELHDNGITGLQWSPTETYLTFERYKWLAGGSENYFVVMNTQTHDNFTLNAGNPYYASYHPIWAEDEDWFLITLKAEYITSTMVPETSHEGDVYLVNSETGETYRLTYTPAIFESNVHWTPEGGIAFTVWTEQEYAFTLEEAMNVEVVPSDEIVMPEPIDPSDYYDPMSGVMVSPDPDTGAWIGYASEEETGHRYELKIGYIWSVPHTAHFSIPLPNPPNSSYPVTSFLIGWRPSDYPYTLG